MNFETKRYRAGYTAAAVMALLLIFCTQQATGQSVEVGLEVIATGLTAPLAAIEPPDDSGRLFVVDQSGRIRIIDADDQLLPTPFLDVSAPMISLDPGFDERGLLGLAFHPDFASNGRFFIYYSVPLRDGGPAGWNHTSRIAEFRVSDGDPNLADPQSERVIIEVDQPQSNHNAGALAIGPDGHLYIALGDGGGANDSQFGHVSDWYTVNAGGNGQDVTQNLLGSILRIDIDSDDPYAIPPDNPFVGRDGLDEIYAYGLRNPYRMSFDMGGDHMLIAADVGQARWEEVNRIEAGGNYGWNVREGAHCFDAQNSNANPTNCPEFVGPNHPDQGRPLIDPVLEYDNNSVGIAIVGGYVYRGTRIPELSGRYIFGDWTGPPATPTSPVFVATPSDEGTWPWEPLAIADGGFRQRILAFGQDRSGEMYILGTSANGPSGTSGTVSRLVPVGGVASEGRDQVPTTIRLHQNYPNPFNPTTQISFELDHSGYASLVVFDVLGRAVATLRSGIMEAGSHTVAWNAADDAGNPVPGGIYVYQLRTDGDVVSRTMVLLR